MDYKQSSEIWLVVDDMQLNTVELWTECNWILWNCERNATEYCGDVNEVQLNTVWLWTECNWILWNSERSAAEYCGTVNGVQQNTVELWTLWNSWLLLCLHCVSDHKESVTVRFYFCHWVEQNCRLGRERNKQRNVTTSALCCYTEADRTASESHNKA